MKKFLVITSFLVLVFCFGCKRSSEIAKTQEPLSQITPQETQNITTTNQTLQEPVPSTEPMPAPSETKETLPSSKEIQTALKNAGLYEGAIDGKIGPKTQEAIKKFQQENNLKVDGKVGPKTWAVLKKYLTNTSTSETTQTSAIKD
jgi:peptidoglycan hydrolase-like protein with peptidoglycan-binding domain